MAAVRNASLLLAVLNIILVDKRKSQNPNRVDHNYIRRTPTAQTTHSTSLRELRDRFKIATRLRQNCVFSTTTERESSPTSHYIYLMEGSVTPCPTLLCALCFTILLRPKPYEHGVFQVQSFSIKWTYFLIIMAAKSTRVPVTLVHQTGGYMREETVKLLLSNLLVLRGHIRDAHIRIQALEDVLNDVGGPHHARYFALVAQYEHDPRFSYPLEDIEGLRKKLLQDQP